MKPGELTVCGLAAVRALFARDASAVVRLYFDDATGRKAGPICRTLAAARKVYRRVGPDELEKIAGTVHHGGIVAVMAERRLRPPRPEEVRRWARTGDGLLLLDRIGNAHNLGAIVRTAAFFGVPRIVIADHPQQARPGEAAYRVAQGGMEHVEIYAVKSLSGFIRDLRPFYLVVGATVRGGERLGGGAEDRSGAGRPAAAAPRPMALVLGNEEQGLAADVEAACERRTCIPGGGAVESLNVAAAAAILLHHFFGSLWRRGNPRSGLPARPPGVQ